MITYFKYIISGIFVVFISCELSEKEIIEKNTFLIESIDPNEDDFRDLEFLKEILSDKKVLFLGESAHGDGSTFQAKIRLIKFLHEDLNYKLIAFEGATITDFYELNASKRKQCDLNKITRVFKTQLAPIWSATREFTPFYEYALENCNSLDFVGIDSNFGMTHSMSSALLKILEEDYNIRNNQEFEYEIFRSQFKELISKSYDLDLLSFDFDLFEQNLNLLKKIVNDNQNRESNKSEFIIQELSNLSLNANAIRKGLDRGNQMRDRQMADNLIWVLNNRPINEKVIVWTANFHSAKKLKEAIFNEQENFYEHYTTFAEFVSDAYGFDNVYSIATTSSTGKHNTFSKLDSIIAPEGSWEFQFANNSKMDYGFINYSQINKTSIGDQEFESVILGHVPHLGKWYKIFDGVLFIKKMKPSNFYYWENYE